MRRPTFNPGIWPHYTEECRRDMDELLRAGGSLSAYRANKNYGSGPKEGSWAWRLEREIERQFKVKHAVVTNSGTAALHCALHGSAIRDREVVVSPYTFSATVAAIVHAGGIPRFADVDPDHYCITKETVKRVLTRRTAAVLPVHIFGRLGDVDDLRSFGLPVVEDACQSVGARLDERYAGTLGAAGVFSFNGAKNAPAGECGAMVTNDQRRADQARLLANHAENFGAQWVGFNYRPNEMTCLVAYHGLKELRWRNEVREELADYLNMKMDWMVEELNRHVYYVFPFKVKAGTRERFVKRMATRGVRVSQGYITPPLHKYPAFRQYARGRLPVVEELSAKTLCLLDCVRPPATIADMEYVAQAMKESL